MLGHRITERPQGPAPRPGLGRRVVTAAVTLAVVVLAPVAVVLLVATAFGEDRGAGSGAGVDVAVGALFGLLLCVRAGTRTAAVAVPGLAVAVTLAGLAVGSWWWVALLGALGLLAGLALQRAALVPVALIGMAASVAREWDLDVVLPQHTVLVLAGACWAVAAARWLGVPPVVPGPRADREVATLAGAVLAAGVAVAAATALLSGARLAYWLPMTVFLLVVPVQGVALHRSARERVVGTALAVGVGMVLAPVDLPGGVRLSAAAIALVLALATPSPVWVGALLSSLAIVLLLDPARSGLVAAEIRLLATALAGGIVLAGAALVLRVARRNGWVPVRSVPSLPG